MMIYLNTVLYIWYIYLRIYFIQNYLNPAEITNKQTKQNVTYQKPLKLFIWIIKHKTWNKQNVFKLYNNNITHINNKQNKQKNTKLHRTKFSQKKNLRKLETEPPTSTKEKNKNEQTKKPMNHKKRDKQKVL